MDKLTTQEQTFVKELVKTGNKTQAVVKAYKEKDLNYAHVKGHRLIRKDTIKKAMVSIADSIKDEKLIKVLNEGLEAGKPTQEGIEPDYSVRHKYLETALKLKGLPETDEQKNINVLMPVLVRFLHEKDERSSNGNTA